jgi:hypothetical protein
VPQLVRPEPSIFASVAAGVTPGRRISRTLALAVACLVLLSGALVAGAAREVCAAARRSAGGRCRKPRITTSSSGTAAERC